MAGYAICSRCALVAALLSPQGPVFRSFISTFGMIWRGELCRAKCRWAGVLGNAGCAALSYPHLGDVDDLTAPTAPSSPEIVCCEVC